MKGEIEALIVLDRAGRIDLAPGTACGLLGHDPPEELERRFDAVFSRASSSIGSEPSQGTPILLGATGTTESSRRRRHAIHRSLGHELRGVLNTWALQVALLRETLQDASGDGDREERLRRRVDVLARRQRDLQRTLDHLLEISRPAGGERTSFDLREVCGEAIRLSRPPDSDRVEPLLEAPAAAVIVVDDRDAARQAILEALLFTLDAPDGGVRVRLGTDGRDARLTMVAGGPEPVLRAASLTWSIAVDAETR